MFSRTNLLTRCHSASYLFSSVFGSQKGRKSIFSELDGTKAKVNILPEDTWSPNERRRGATGGPHQPMARAALGRARAWCGPPGRPPTSPLRL